MRPTPRRTVEDCPVSLSNVWLRWLARLSDRAPGETVLLTLPNPLGGPLARIECEWCVWEPDGLGILVRAEDAGGAALCYRQMIPIVATAPNFGGERYWFRCDCGRRVGRLFLPWGAREFQCRHCLNLTYRSAQQHDATLCALARDDDAIGRALSSGKIGRQLRGMNALTLRLKWSLRGRLPFV